MPLGRDQKDLSENLAAAQGLAQMIMECDRLFEVSERLQPLSFLIAFWNSDKTVGMVTAFMAYFWFYFFDNGTD